jgi:apolipoprotein N-acyltransferase
MFAFSDADCTVLIRMGSLFGMLMVSFLVVLINSLILILLKRVVQALTSRATFPGEDDTKPYFYFKEIVLQKRWYCTPSPRAPP